MKCPVCENFIDPSSPTVCLFCGLDFQILAECSPEAQEHFVLSGKREYAKEKTINETHGVDYRKKAYSGGGPRQKPQWETPEIHRMLMEPVPSGLYPSPICIQFEIGREKVYPHA